VPGIFGVVDVSPVPSEARQRELSTIVERMAAAMRYEPSYSSTLVSCPALGAYVGHVGRWCSESPESAAPPTLVVVTTGDTTGEGGHGAVTPGDTVVHLGAGSRQVGRAYQSAGGNGLSDLTTLVAGFVIDERRAMCLLFNDRFGLERIFLHTDGTRTVFSSEAKAILAVAPRTRAFDATGLSEWLAYGCTVGNRSLFSDIEVLDGGTVLTFSVGRVGRRRYFDHASLEQLEPVLEDQFLEGFSASFGSAVNGLSNSFRQVGVSLTGGIDSRMVMASLDAPRASVPCYTFGSMYRTTADASIARQVAAACGQPHQILELGREFLTNAPQELERAVYISDGYMGCSGAAELYLNRLSRSIAPGRMTGNWGGELMRGVRAFKRVLPKEEFLEPLLERRMRESADVTTGPEWNPLSFALFRQMPLHGYGRYAIERSQVEMRAPFLASDVVNWLYRGPAAVRASAGAYRTVIGRRPELLAIPTDGGRLGTGPEFLKTLRRPYRRVVAKAEYLTSHGAPHWMAMLSASLPSPLLETRFLGRDKFQHFRLWFRRELAGFLRDTLSADASGDLGAWFDMRRVGVMVAKHVAGRANFTDELDKVLTVAVAEKTFFRPDIGLRRPVPKD